MAVIDVVKWDASPGVFAWKFPSQELSTWTQLIVSESQEAILLKEGRSAGPFGAGRHVLSTANYPVLTDILKIATGRSPFTAEVWFIQKAFKLDVKWGTSDAIQLEDPRYHIMLPVRAFGQYGIVVEDSSKFLLKLVGTLPAFVERTLVTYFRGIIVTRVKDMIAKHLVEKQVSILQITAHLNDISGSLEQQISNELAAYGIRIVNFNVNSISTDDHDPAVRKLKEALAAKAEMDIMGYSYQQKRTFDTLETAAGNTGGGSGVMNAGIGIGMGVGIGAPIGNMMGALGQNLQTSPSSIPCPGCGRVVMADSAFCASCGTNLKQSVQPESEAMTECDKCGTKSPRGTKFCPNCGDIFFCCPECGCDNPEDATVCRECGKPLPQKCPQCGASQPGGLKFCGECGAKLQKGFPSCGAPQTPGMKFCPECGTKLN